MAKDTGISWTHTHHADGTVTPGATWNPLLGCSRVSSGCKNCYAIQVAEKMPAKATGQVREDYTGLTMRHANGMLDWTGLVRLIPRRLGDPARWTKPKRIFVNSMSDLYHETVSFSDIDRIFEAMAACTDRHTFLILTKRPEVAIQWFAHAKTTHPEWFDGEGQLAIGKVWIGVSVEDQKAADTRCPLLLELPLWRRFLSCEPLLGPVNLSAYLSCPVCDDLGSYQSTMPWSSDEYLACECGGSGGTPRIPWVIVGGESGKGFRPMDLDWARSIRDQCAEYGSVFYFKQSSAFRSGQGNVLDGQKWEGMVNE